VYRWRELVAGAGREQENLSSRYERPVERGEVGLLVVEREDRCGDCGHIRKIPDARHRGGPVRSSDEGPVMGLERRDRAGQVDRRPTPAVGEEPTDGPKLKVKSFDISKRLIAGAWEKVQANGGAPGVDAVSISLFKDDEISNLYKVWNRMSALAATCPVRCGRWRYRKIMERA
jgi:hypothetical protein